MTSPPRGTDTPPPGAPPKAPAPETGPPEPPAGQPVAWWRWALAIAIVAGLAGYLGWALFLRAEPEPPPSITDRQAPAGQAPANEQEPPQAEPASRIDQPPDLAILASETTDWRAILRAHQDYAEWLLRNPNPALVGKIMHPDCDCHERATQMLAEWQEKGLHWEWDGTGPLWKILTVEQSLAPGAPADDPRELDVLHLEAWMKQTSIARLVDDTGTVQATDEPPQGTPPGEEFRSMDFVRAGPGHPWLLRTFNSYMGDPENGNG